MPSIPLTQLTQRLAEIDEIIAARDAICIPGAGKPANDRGAAVLRAGVVLLGALFEEYIEDLFDVAVDIAFASHPVPDRKKLKSNTSGRNNNANVHQVNTLFFNLGIPWIMSHKKCHWQKFTNASVQERLGKMAKARNEVAHGEHRRVRKADLFAWRWFAENLAGCLDAIVADHLSTITGKRPW